VILLPSVPHRHVPARTEPGLSALLTTARRQLERFISEEAQRAHAAGALLIDTRTDGQRLHQGNLRQLGLSRATDVIGAWKSGSPPDF